MIVKQNIFLPKDEKRIIKRYQNVVCPSSQPYGIFAP